MTSTTTSTTTTTTNSAFQIGEQQILVLPSGRRLSYALYGALPFSSPSPTPTPTAPPKIIFYHHGFPGSRLEASTFLSRAAAARGLTLVAVDRPGYGGPDPLRRSTFQEGRTLADWVDDVRAVAEELRGNGFGRRRRRRRRRPLGVKREGDRQRAGEGEEEGDRVGEEDMGGAGQGEGEEGEEDEEKWEWDGRFAVLGFSGGGPYALAAWHVLAGSNSPSPTSNDDDDADAAAARPPPPPPPPPPPSPPLRCVGAALVASMWPLSLGGTRGMLAMTRLVLTAAAAASASSWWSSPGPWLVEKAFALGVDVDALEDTARPERYDGILGRAMKGRPAADRRAWEEDVDVDDDGDGDGDGEGGGGRGRGRTGLREALRESTRGALSGGGNAVEGARGAAWDARVLGRDGDWGFGLEEVVVRREGELVVWHGREDANVPVEMARRARDRMRKGGRADKLRFIEREGESHLSIVVNEVEAVMQALDEMFSLE